MSNDALLAHIVSQTQANVDFLVQNNYVTQADASGLLRKLLTLSAPPTKAAPVPSSFYTAPPIAPRQMPAPSPAPAANVVTAKALWDYNKSGADADDLSFAAGDIITIVEETNDDWWMGEVHGRRALFPSNYVEKVMISAPATPARTLPPAYNPSASSYNPMAQPPVAEPVVAPAGGAKAYKPFMASHSNAPPPPGAGTNTVGLQQDGGQDQKKSKFGKYGNTMAHSAAGGVGFGAGAAIGGGLVRAIF